MIGFILGPDRNSGSGPLRYPFRWNLGWYRYRFRLGTGRFGRYQTGTAIFYVVFRSYDELPASRAPVQFSGWITCTRPVPRLNHVLPSSSQTASRALLQFPGCITCSPPVPRLYHVLPSSSQNVSCPHPPPPLWRHLERNRNGLLAAGPDFAGCQSIIR